MAYLTGSTTQANKAREVGEEMEFNFCGIATKIGIRIQEELGS
jgi:hypothetical protein